MMMKTGNLILIVNLKTKMMRRSPSSLILSGIKMVNHQRGETGQSLLQRDRFKTWIQALHPTCLGEAAHHPVKAMSNKFPSFEWTLGKILDIMVCKFSPCLTMVAETLQGVPRACLYFPGRESSGSERRLGTLDF